MDPGPAKRQNSIRGQILGKILEKIGKLLARFLDQGFGPENAVYRSTGTEISPILCL